MSYKFLKVSSENFRNLDNCIIEFSKGINCILGENGNGKTNLLEVLYYLANRKSFRKNTSFPQLLSIDSEQFQIQISAVLQDVETERNVPVSAKLTSEQAFWWVDGQPKKSKLNLPIVFINPFDSFSFHTSPTFRRNWFDTHLGLLDKTYKTLLGKYQKAIRMRNQLLTQGKRDYVVSQISALDRELAKYQLELSTKRVTFLSELSEFCSPTFEKIFSEKHDLQLDLESKIMGLSEQNIFDLMQKSLEKDFQIGKTNSGIHRDDYVFHFDGFNSFEFCSLGQQKMSYLSLVFAYIELFRYKFKTYPVVLIDDVSGELDRQRWGRLISYLREKDFQVFITTANENFRDELEKIEEAKKIYFSQGKIQEARMGDSSGDNRFNCQG